MNPAAMAPFGMALLAHHQGEPEVQVVGRRDDGLEVSLPMSHFFRTPAEFSRTELTALERCHGRVLDVGAGTGLHTLALQGRGLEVTALDVCASAVEIMAVRGVQHAQLGDILDLRDQAFDTLLMLGHGIGMVEDLNGFDEFLRQARDLVRPGGQLLLHSIDVSRTNDPVHLAYHETRRASGCYIGEVRMQFVYREHSGPFFGWLHVDADLLASRAQDAGWTTEVLVTEDDGDYLARLAVGRAGTSAP